MNHRKQQMNNLGKIIFLSKTITLKSGIDSIERMSVEIIMNYIRNQIVMLSFEIVILHHSVTKFPQFQSIFRFVV